MSRDDSNSPSAHRRLALVLRILGVLDMLAVLAVFAPWGWLMTANCAAGLAEPPPLPLLQYLIRSASAMYVLHGATVCLVSFDVVRYRPLIRFLAWFAIVHGGVMLAVDFAAGMPLWWSLLEGPAIAATGVIVLLLSRQARLDHATLD